jgi:D-alanyl-D-alanine carboxypeptidase
MSQTASARTRTRRLLRPYAVGLVVVTASIIGILFYQSASSLASPFSEAPSPGAHRAVPQSAASSAPSFSEVLRGDHGGATTEDDGAVTEDDGALPDGVTVFDDEYPGLAKLDIDLLRALREAATDAAEDGIEFYVTSGWRSPEYQNQLLREAVSTYGSEREAARWVATADTSAHVSGDAVDIGSFDATAWLSEHGARYGLCQIYRNESWHYELRPQAIDRECPPMYADPAHDPSMQQ